MRQKTASRSLIALLVLVLLIGGNPVAALAIAGPPGSGPAAEAVAADRAASQQALPQAQGAAPVIPCTDLPTRDFSALPDATLRIAGAVEVAATGSDPASCKVTGTVGANAQFVVQLPVTGWTGQYFQSGCGGYCGNLNPGADCQAAFSRGAALGYSDLGTKGMNDLSWALDDGARRDFAYAANHQLAVAAKALIAAYYGQPPAHSYFIGCSDGGREALMEAQRFPDDFDGIVAGAPAYLLAFLNYFQHAWMYRANTDAQGNRIIGADKAAVLHAAVLGACDALDGVQDGLLTDPRDCAYDPGALGCPPDTDVPDCLTPAQVEAARKMYSSPTDAQGRHYYPGGLTYGSELKWAGGAGPMGADVSFDKLIVDAYAGYLSLPLPYQDTSMTADTVRFAPADFFSLLPMASVYNASNPDLTRFRDRGGKLILYHGWADDSIVPAGTLAYYAALQRQMGGLEATQQFARLFMFPGVYHCSGGEGPSHWDMATPIADWVERGVAPTVIVASQYESDVSTAGGGFENPTQVQGPPSDGQGAPAGGPQPAAAARPAGGASSQGPSGRVVRSLPAFAYPLRPQYTGAGDPNDAASYVPVLPATPRQDDVEWIGRGTLAP
ncbi:MAG: tannase/feruloyl esterase family alpha/beta hydrolase [Chloroflexi bacterium]|nr:tannase/feruloyl esterase family alpha/beta hydrolase [Chloroflexota bacterium]